MSSHRADATNAASSSICWPTTISLGARCAKRRARSNLQPVAHRCPIQTNDAAKRRELAMSQAMTASMQTGAAVPAANGGPSRWESTAPIRYPDPDIVVLDPRFQHMVLGNAAIERIATGFRFTEGPAYYGDGRYLLFSDIPNDRLLR